MTIAIAAIVVIVVDVVGITTGQFIQRGLGPVVVFASLFIQLLFVLAMALLGTAIGWLLPRHRVRSSRRPSNVALLLPSAPSIRLCA